jgi:ribosomal protein S27E
MDTAQHLMLHGVTAVCPDCGDERILLEVAEAEFCCTSCDAAVLLFPPTERVSGRGGHGARFAR